MRVLHVTEASASGTLGVVGAIAGHAAEAGHDVAVAHGSRPETPTDLAAALPGAELFALPWGARGPGAQLAAGRALRRLVAAWRPDVVHLHSSFAGLVGLALDPGLPQVFTPHGWASARAGEDGARRAAYRAFDRVVARHSDVVGAVSRAEAARARALGARRVVVVPNGIPELDGDPPASGPVPSRAPLVVGAGRIGPARRPAASARILAALGGAAGVAWIGASPAAEDRPLRAAGIPITGWLPRDDALARLSAATAYLHWSAWDGQSLAVLEALAHDVVVIGSDIPANREVLGRAQVCRREGEAVALLRRVLVEPALRAAFLDAQRATRPLHGARRMAAAWLDVHRRLAAPARARVMSWS